MLKRHIIASLIIYKNNLSILKYPRNLQHFCKKIQASRRGLRLLFAILLLFNYFKGLPANPCVATAAHGDIITITELSDRIAQAIVNERCFKLINQCPPHPLMNPGDVVRAALGEMLLITRNYEFKKSCLPASRSIEVPIGDYKKARSDGKNGWGAFCENRTCPAL